VQFFLKEPVLWGAERFGSKKVLASYNIKYVIVGRENLTLQQINLVQALFGKASKGAPVVYEEGPMIVYALN
jgi:hypothetical protein